jgi:hypothetical protein
LAKPLTIDSSVLERLRGLGKSDRVVCLQALLDLVDAFGAAHRHSGAGVRKLGTGLFECRAGLQWRFVVQNRSEDLYIAFRGDHDEVRRLLRSGRYPR